jgi:hypothetical protein
VDPRIGLNDVERDNSSPYRDSNSDPSVVQPIASRYTYYAISDAQGQICLFFLRDEIIGGWRKLHNKELHNLYSSPNKIRMITSRRMRWVDHVQRKYIRRICCRG